MSLTRLSGGETSGAGALSLLVGLLLFVSLSRVHQAVGFLAAIRPALLLAGLSVLYVLVRPSIVNFDSLSRFWPTKVMAGLGLLAVFSAPFGLSLGSSASYLLNEYSKVLILAFLVVLAVRSTADLTRLMWAYVASCGVLVFMAMFLFELSGAASSVAQRLDNLYKYDANDLGVLLLTGLPMAILLFQNQRGWKRWVAALIVLGIGAAIARSGSRGAFVGLLAVGVALLLMLRHVAVAKRIGFVAVVALGLLLMAPQGYWQQMETLTEPTADYNWTDPYGRKAVAQRGVGYMLEHPVTGVGINNFSRAEATISQRARDFQYLDRPGVTLRWVAPHNSYIQVGSELGIPGLLLWVALVVGAIVGPIRLRRRLPAGWRRAEAEKRFLYGAALYLPVSMVAFAVTCTFVSFAYLDVVYVLTAFVAGLYLCVERELADGAAAVGLSWDAPSRAGTRVRATGGGESFSGAAVPEETWSR